MFSLDLPTEPYWMDLLHDVRVKVRPLDGVVVAAARAFADRVVLAMVRERAERVAAKAPLDGLPDVGDPDMRKGIFLTEMAVGLARYGIVDWEGIGGADGTALAFSTNGAERLARSSIGPTFADRYERPAQVLAAEGNASAAAPSGGSAAAPIIAAAAPASTSENDASSAPAA